MVMASSPFDFTTLLPIFLYWNSSSQRHLDGHTDIQHTLLYSSALKVLASFQLYKDFRIVYIFVGLYIFIYIHGRDYYPLARFHRVMLKIYLTSLRSLAVDKFRRTKFDARITFSSFYFVFHLKNGLTRSEKNKQKRRWQIPN